MNTTDIPGSPDATAVWYAGQDRLCAEAMAVGVEAIARFTKPNGDVVGVHDVRYRDLGSTCRDIAIGQQMSAAKLQVCMVWDIFEKCGAKVDVLT